MLTVIETQEFIAQAGRIWTVEQRDAFVDWIAVNPLAGVVIPGADGARKVRWAASGRGKRGGARVIYFTLLDDGAVVLLAVYIKAEQADMPRQQIRRAKREAE